MRSLAVLLLVVSVVVAQQNLIKNPGFETGYFAPWTQSGMTIVTSSPNPYEGTYCAKTATNSSGAIEQVFNPPIPIENIVGSLTLYYYNLTQWDQFSVKIIFYYKNTTSNSFTSSGQGFAPQWRSFAGNTHAPGDHLVKIRIEAFNVALDNITLMGNPPPSAVDIQTTAIVAPTGTVSWNTPVTPQATLRNNGPIDAVGISARLDIRDGAQLLYTNTQSNISLSSGESRTFSFGSWTPSVAGGPFSVRCTTIYDTDTFPANDVASASFSVRKLDVECVSILTPSGEVPWNSTIAPQAVVRNNGTEPASFEANFYIEDGSGYFSTVMVSGLGAGKESTLTFAGWTASRLGGPFALRCTTRLTGDQVYNDKKQRSVAVVLAAPNLIGPVHGDTIRAPYQRRPEFSWQNLGEGVSYRLQIAANPNFTPPLNFNVVTQTAGWWTPAPGLSEGKYYWRVAAKVGEIQGSYSEIREFTIDLTPPATPNLLEPAQDTGKTNVSRLDWAAIPDAREFSLDLKKRGVTMPGFPVSIAQPAGDFSFYELSSPLDTGVYTWRVVAKDYAGNTSASAYYWFAIDTVPPARPVLIWPTGGISVRTLLPAMDWSYVADARRYHLRIRSTDYALDRDITQVAGQDNSSYRLASSEKLRNGRDYTWTVEAYDWATNASGPSFSGSFSVEMPEHDVGVAGILVPPEEVSEHLPLRPKVKVENFGLQTESFDVRIMITDSADKVVFDQTGYVSGLVAEQAREYEFQAQWVPEPAGTYLVKTWTELGTDQYRANDTLTQTVVVRGWPAGWHEVEPLPFGPTATKAPKAGAWLVTGPDKDSPGTVIYAAKGNKTGDFQKYYPAENRWVSLPSIPDSEPALGKAKPVAKGSRAVSDGEQYLYVLKGNNTQGFWRYRVEDGTWDTLTRAPQKIKGGNDMVYVERAGKKYVYLLGGGKTAFYRYDIDENQWTMLDSVPYGNNKKKYAAGSFLVYDKVKTIYAHQANVIDEKNARHYMFRYDLEGDSWYTTPLKGMPLLGTEGGSENKKKKSKDGAAGVWYNGYLYAIKGGGSQGFYKYDPAGSGTWIQLETIPRNGSGGKKTVKDGGSLTVWKNAFFLLKGNKTYEFWRYVQPVLRAPSFRAQVSGVQGQAGAQTAALGVAPNPLAKGFATVRYNPSKTGPISITVYDAAGRAVFREAYSTGCGGSVTLDLRRLSAGVYLVQFETPGQRLTGKVTVQR